MNFFISTQNNSLTLGNKLAVHKTYSFQNMTSSGITKINKTRNSLHCLVTQEDHIQLKVFMQIKIDHSLTS